MASNKQETAVQQLSPEEQAYLPSRLFFIWVQPLFTRASQLHREGKALELDDLLPLPTADKGTTIHPRFEEAWEAGANTKDSTYTQNTTKTLEDLQKKGADFSTTRITRVLTHVIGSEFIVAGFIKALNTVLQFSFPLLLQEILQYIEEAQTEGFAEDAPWYEEYRGYWLSVLLLLAMTSKAMTENSYFHKVMRAGYQARIAISTAVYTKALRLANAERQSTTLGELVNLMQVDATKIEMFVPQFHVLWDGLLQISGYMAILYTLIGWPCFAGLAVMILAAPVQGIIMGKLFGQSRQMVKYTDERVKTTNEALQGIQCVKMYTWEQSFGKQIERARNDELEFLKRSAYLRGFSRSYMSALPGIVAVVSFSTYALFKEDSVITASTLFAALLAFDQLRFPLMFYPMSLAQYAQAKVSAARLEVFLGMKEVGRGEQIGSGTYVRREEENGGITVQNANVYWSDPDIPIEVSRHSSINGSITLADDSDAEDSRTTALPTAALKNVSFEVKTGELCAVIGQVASGKSTLCSAILNETILESGKVTLSGKVAYAAQTPWVLNATLRENILFGLPYDEEKYHRVVAACQLTHDLDMLEDGDMTEIGERGINLSGGQKQRVSVARVAYSNAETIILDDPLSALDPEVGRKLFEECIVNHLKGRTILFVTNQLQFLKQCDSIVALQKGTVLEQGSFDDLMAAEKSEVKRLIAELQGGREGQKQKSSKDEEGGAEVAATKKDAPVKPATKKDAKQLVSKEERNIGAVSLSVYLKYLVAGGGYLKFMLIYFGVILSVSNGIATTAWVSYWTSDNEYENNSEGFYLGVYAGLAVTLGIFTFFRSYLLAKFGIEASFNLHGNLLDSILSAPQSFFDTTPIGRIISRFSKDLYSIDIELTDMLDFFIFCSLQVVLVMSTIMFVTPWFGVAIVPLAYFYFRTLNYFREVARETKRLDSISRSPVYAHFSETLGGLTTIRAYNENTRFRSDFEGKLDTNTRAYYCNKVADRWLSVRLETIGAFIAGLAAVFATNVALEGSASGKESESDFASLAGLSLTSAISVTGLLNWCVRTFAQTEAAMNATERVLYYTEHIPQEAAYTSAKLLKDSSSFSKNKKDLSPAPSAAVYAVASSGGTTAPMSAQWPEKGEIVLKDLTMRYRSDTPLVLKGLNVTIAGGERVGVVGRTGSGKSSLLLTLLRLVEPAVMPVEGESASEYEAPLKIDGVDVMRIGLRELRSKLGIIPQNPVLFSGTVRSNVDPFDDYTDDQIWVALDQCGMKESVLEMPGELQASVAEYGENLSAGMRQMLVLGRALLRQCRILLLDEATSSVDFETDRAIQRTIREAFQGCTVITIAHRINTIMDSDKILVMKDGVAAEFDAPGELLKNEESLFAEIVRHSEAEKENM